MSKKTDFLGWFKTHIFRAFFFLAASEGIIILLFVFRTPSEAGQRILFGFSLSRLGFAAAILFLALFFWGMGILLGRNPSLEENLRQKTRRSPSLLLIFLAATAFFFSLRFLTPSYYFGDYFGYLKQIYPALFWFFLIALQSFVFLFLLQEDRKISTSAVLDGYNTENTELGGKGIKSTDFLRSDQKNSVKFVPSVFKKKLSNTAGRHPTKSVSVEKNSLKQALVEKPFLLLFASLLALWGFIAWTGLGIIPDDRFWNEPGVPLLNAQILFAGLAAWLLFFVVRYLSTQKKKFFLFVINHKDLLLALSLWGVAAFFWINEPLPENFFAVGPYPPTGQHFPYADSQNYDLGGQSALIGRGLYQGVYMGRAFLSGFLAILHLLAGQNYEKVVALQSLLFAALPAILYLLGTRLHSRVAGVFLALLSIFKTLNAIASSTLILSVHPKYMLTEFATGILLALYTLWLVQWYREDKPSSLLLAGGALGWGIMLRTHLIVFIPLFVFLALFKYRLRWKKILVSTALLLLAFFITISPWMWRSNQVRGKPFFFLQSFPWVMEHRYGSASPLSLLEGNSYKNAALSNPAVRALRIQPASSRKPKQEDEFPFSASLPLIVANHFSHNLVTAFFALPTTPVFHDLRHTILSAYPYWGKQALPWDDGRLSFSEKAGVTWNLFLISLGLYGIWRKWGIAATIPLLVFLFYHAANAVARTSGGRYLVPVDWVLMLYYAVGITRLTHWLLASLGIKISIRREGNNEIVPKFELGWRQGTLNMMPFFLMIFAITLIDQVIPLRYPQNTSQEVARLNEEALPFSAGEMDAFLAQPNARLWQGRSLYPRFYPANDGEPSRMGDVFGIRDFPRLTLVLIGNFGRTEVLLPLDESPTYFPNAEDVIVLGCYNYQEHLLEAHFILLQDEKDIAYWSSSKADLICE